MNRARCALSRIKSGRLAQLLNCCSTLNLLISDVPGDDPGVIGSGLLTRSDTAIDLASYPQAVRELLLSPPLRSSNRASIFRTDKHACHRLSRRCKARRSSSRSGAEFCGEVGAAISCWRCPGSGSGGWSRCYMTVRGWCMSGAAKRRLLCQSVPGAAGAISTWLWLRRLHCRATKRCICLLPEPTVVTVLRLLPVPWSMVPAYAVARLRTWIQKPVCGVPMPEFSSRRVAI